MFVFLLPEAKVSVPHIVSSTWLSRRHAGNFTIIGNTGNIFFLPKLLFNSTTQNCLHTFLERGVDT